nr:hypothetical protein Iba_chr15eCG7510 [Ipomoea batatas]
MILSWSSPWLSSVARYKAEVMDTEVVTMAAVVVVTTSAVEVLTGAHRHCLCSSKDERFCELENDGLKQNSGLGIHWRDHLIASQQQGEFHLLKLVNEPYSAIACKSSA